MLEKIKECGVTKAEVLYISPYQDMIELFCHTDNLINDDIQSIFTGFLCTDLCTDFLFTLYSFFAKIPDF